MYRRVIKPVLFSLTIEQAHHAVLLLLRIIGLIPGGRWLLRKCYAVEHQQDDVVGPLDVEREEQGFYDPSVHDAAKVLKSRMGAKPKCVRFGRTFRRDKRVVTAPKVVKID